LRLLVGFASVLALCGCFHKQIEVSQVEQTQDLFPDKFEMPVTLRLANVEIEANARMTVEGATRTISISKEGVPIEDEVYIVTRESVSLKSLSTGEAFEPPLVLFELPLAIGDTYDWVGKIDFAGPALDAKAHIVTSRDHPELATGPREAVKVAVELRIDDGSPKEAVRNLNFWFAPGVGPIRRDDGIQVRTPR
jgi:hypothetical protein